MTKRQTAIIGGVFGLMASSVVIVLLWYGVSGVLYIGHTDYMYVLWPSSMMLVVSWCRTVPGIMITVSSIAINCLMYAAIALLLRMCIRLIALPFRKGDARL
ncbi:MAG: hypothetical protein ABSC88_06715 [Terracidiphilus sp.]|jgi:hypothetical protein